MHHQFRSSQRLVASYTLGGTVGDLTLHKFHIAEPEFVNLLKEPRNRFPAWQAGTTTRTGPPGYMLEESIP